MLLDIIGIFSSLIDLLACKIVVPCEYDEFESNFKKGTGKLVKDGYICVFDKSGMQIRHMKKRNDSEDYYDDGDISSVYDNP